MSPMWVFEGVAYLWVFDAFTKIVLKRLEKTFILAYNKNRIPAGQLKPIKSYREFGSHPSPLKMTRLCLQPEYPYLKIFLQEFEKSIVDSTVGLSL